MIDQEIRRAIPLAVTLRSRVTPEEMPPELLVSCSLLAGEAQRDSEERRT
jgi:hypothetical protein